MRKYHSHDNHEVMNIKFNYYQDIRSRSGLLVISLVGKIMRFFQNQKNQNALHRHLNGLWLPVFLPQLRAKNLLSGPHVFFQDSLNDGNTTANLSGNLSYSHPLFPNLQNGCFNVIANFRPANLFAFRSRPFYP